MSNTDPETPVGQIPVTGGRERRYANDAERARAWRERQKERRGGTYDESAAETVSPVLAEASLAVLLERLTEVGRAHEATVGELIGRVEEAINALADPEAVAEALAGGRAEAARQVAEAEERAIRATQAKTAAEATARQAVQDRVEAEEAANAAWERAESLEAELAALGQEVTAARENAAQEAQRHEKEITALRAVHADQLAEEIRKAEDKIVEAQKVAQAAVEEAHASRDRSEGIATELRTELEAAERSAELSLATARSEAAAARAELSERLSSRYEAQLEVAKAKADGEITRAEAQAEGARQLAESRADEVARLVTQVEDLRADLLRARR